MRRSAISKTGNTGNLTDTKATSSMDTRFSLPNIRLVPEDISHGPKPRPSQLKSTTISFPHPSRVATRYERGHPTSTAKYADNSSAQLVASVPIVRFYCKSPQDLVRPPLHRGTLMSNSVRSVAPNEIVRSQVHVFAGGNSTSVEFQAPRGLSESNQEPQQGAEAPVPEPTPRPALADLLYIARANDTSRPLSVQSRKDLAGRCLHARQKGRQAFHKDLWTIEPTNEPAPPGKDYFAAFFDGQLVEGIRLVLVHGEAMEGGPSEKVCVYGCLLNGSHRLLSNVKYVNPPFHLHV